MPGLLRWVVIFLLVPNKASVHAKIQPKWTYKASSCISSGLTRYSPRPFSYACRFLPCRASPYKGRGLSDFNPGGPNDTKNASEKSNGGLDSHPSERECTVMWYDTRKKFGMLVCADTGATALFHESSLPKDEGEVKRVKASHASVHATFDSNGAITTVRYIDPGETSHKAGFDAMTAALNRVLERVQTLKGELLASLEDRDEAHFNAMAMKLQNTLNECPLHLRRKLLRSSVWDLLLALHVSTQTPRPTPLPPSLLTSANTLFNHFRSGLTYSFSPRQRRILEEITGNVKRDIEEETIREPLGDRVEKRLGQARKILCTRIGRVVAILEGVEDPDNVAGIFRTCDALGIQEVWVAAAESRKRKMYKSGNRGFNRVSRRAQQWLTVRTFPSTEALLMATRKQNISLFVSALPTSIPDAPDIPPSLSVRDPGLADVISGAEEGKRFGVVVGNEMNGVTDEMIRAAEYLIHIPMSGFVESLNVGIAAALLLFKISHIVRDNTIPQIGRDQDERNQDERDRCSSEDTNCEGLDNESAKAVWEKWEGMIREPWMYKD
ncbi:hypothetical protein AAMO2058_000118900 [Amorphochlora amoebiformis]